MAIRSQFTGCYVAALLGFATMLPVYSEPLGTNPAYTLVIVSGTGISAQGKSPKELHNEAAGNALKKAALLSSDIERDIQLEGMKVKQEQIHVYSANRVRLERIITSGFITDSTPSLYTVELEASVCMDSPTQPERNNHNPQQPTILLSVQCPGNPYLEEQALRIISQQLDTANLTLTDLSDKSDSMTISCSIEQRFPTETLRLCWDIERNSSKPESDFFEFQQSKGHREIATIDQFEKEVRDVGNTLAVQAARMHDH